MIDGVVRTLGKAQRIGEFPTTKVSDRQLSAYFAPELATTTWRRRTIIGGDDQRKAQLTKTSVACTLANSLGCGKFQGELGASIEGALHVDAAIVSLDYLASRG